MGQTEFGDWIDLNNGCSDRLTAPLCFIAKTYIPLGNAIVEAVKTKEKTFEANIYGVSATFSTHQYRAWAFEQLQLRYQHLSYSEQAELLPLFNETDIMPRLMENGVIHSTLFDGFTPPFIKDGIPDARIKYLKEKGKEIKQV